MSTLRMNEDNFTLAIATSAYVNPRHVLICYYYTYDRLKF